MITIRKEQPSDIEQIRLVNTRAFGRAAEADVVDVLRQACPESLSLVAVNDDTVVGHILFTPVVIEAKDKSIAGMGLAPLAVLPEFQRQGIGSDLARAGLEYMKQAHYPFVIVLGHPWYYPRFGFERASRHGIACEYENAPDEAFMILILDKAALEGAAGIARYRPEFAAAT